MPVTNGREFSENTSKFLTYVHQQELEASVKNPCQKEITNGSNFELNRLWAHQKYFTWEL